jgi:uncharacterized Zn-binding protein involved in type VI secretion
MPMPAARVGDVTAHPGIVAGPGVPNVLIGGQPAAVALDQHACAFPSGHAPTPLGPGNPTVLIGGRPALRVGDVAGCGAAIVSGCPNVLIG